MVGKGKDVKIGLQLNSTDFETGAAATLGANSGGYLMNMPLVEERPIVSTVPLGADMASDWIRQSNRVAADLSKQFRFGSKMHQFLAASMGLVETVSYRDLTKIVEGTATGGTTTTLVDSGAPFGADDAQIGRYVIINSGTGEYQVALITDSDSTTLTFAAITTAPSTDSVYEVVDFAPALYDICSGTATSNTVQILTNTMTTNEHAGSWVTITAGTGIGQTRGITSNTTDTITVDANWVTTPDGTSKLEVMGTCCTHVYALGDTAGYYYTLAAYHKAYIKEFPHLKVGGFEITGTYDDYIMLTIPVICDKEVAPATVNTNQALWTIRQLTGVLPMKKTTTSLLMNRADTGALVAGTDDRKINEFSFKLNQPIEGVLRTGPGTDNVVSEPLQIDHPEAMLDFKEPHTEDSTLKSERSQDKPQKASLTLTGSTLTTNQNNELIILMPNIALINVSDPVDDASFVPTEVTSKLHRASSAPTGISYTDAFKLEITDIYGGNPLQDGNT